MIRWTLELCLSREGRANALRPLTAGETAFLLPEFAALHWQAMHMLALSGISADMTNQPEGTQP